MSSFFFVLFYFRFKAWIIAVSVQDFGNESNMQECREREIPCFQGTGRQHRTFAIKSICSFFVVIQQGRILIGKCVRTRQHWIRISDHFSHVFDNGFCFKILYSSRCFITSLCCSFIFSTVKRIFVFFTELQMELIWSGNWQAKCLHSRRCTEERWRTSTGAQWKIRFNCCGGMACCLMTIIGWFMHGIPIWRRRLVLMLCLHVCALMNKW